MLWNRESVPSAWTLLLILNETVSTTGYSDNARSKEFSRAQPMKGTVILLVKNVKIHKLDVFSLLYWVFWYNIAHSIDGLLDFSGLFLVISCLFQFRNCKIYFVLSQIEVLKYIHSVRGKNLWFGDKVELFCTIWNISYNSCHKRKYVLIKNAHKIRKINKNFNFCSFYLISPSRNIFVQSEW